MQNNIKATSRPGVRSAPGRAVRLRREQGLGTKLISKTLVETKDYAGIESLTRQTLQNVQKLKGQ